jgi:dTMP kinase
VAWWRQECVLIMFITFEGLDFSGKSTQAKLLHEYLKKKKIKSVLLREPGGTKISEKIRAILLDREHLEMIPLTEFLLFSASRAQLVNEIIMPNILKGIVVICDRYYDSSSAYQGFGGNVNIQKVLQVNDFATGGLTPDITFFIDISPKDAFKRAEYRSNTKDRMENKNISFYNRVYKGFKTLAKKNKKRFVQINGTKPVEEIHSEIISYVNKKIKS